MSHILKQNLFKTILNPNSTDLQILNCIDSYFNKYLELDIGDSFLKKIIKMNRTFIFKYMLENSYFYYVNHDIVDYNITHYTFIRFNTYYFLGTKKSLSYYLNLPDLPLSNIQDMNYVEQMIKENLGNKFSINMKIHTNFLKLDHLKITQLDFDNFMVNFNHHNSLDFFIPFLIKRYHSNHSYYSLFLNFFIDYIDKNNLFGYLLKKHDEFTFNFTPMLAHPLFIDFLSKHINKNNMKTLFPVYENHIKHYFSNNLVISDSFELLFTKYFNLKYSSDLYDFVLFLIGEITLKKIDPYLIFNVILKCNIQRLFNKKHSFFSNIAYQNEKFFLLFQILLQEPSFIELLRENIDLIHPELRPYFMIQDF